MEVNCIRQGDCLELLNGISDESIDMILCDLPYGTTNCKWDNCIPLSDYAEINGKVFDMEKYLLNVMKNRKISYEEAVKSWKTDCKEGLWTHYKRIIKPNGVILLFAQTPFDKVLGNSNPGMLRYEWIWEKHRRLVITTLKKCQ